MKVKNDMGRIPRKFCIRTGTMVLMIILVVVGFLGYALCSYYLNVNSIVASNGIGETVTQKDIAIVETLKDILLTCFSIFGIGLLLNALIEKHNKNEIYSDIICNDVLASPYCYDSMTKENKEKMFDALERHIYNSNTLEKEIYDHIRTKLSGHLQDYYFESCQYVITCTVYDNYIEKSITKRLNIKSCNDSFLAKKFCLGFFSGKEIPGIKSYEITKFLVNEEDLTTKIQPQKLETERLDEQNGYDVGEKYVCSEPISFFCDKATKIETVCVSRTAIDDKSTTFRVNKPCKNFELHYTLCNSKHYRLGIDAFGFLDNADDSLNTNDKSSVNIEFKDWIFEYDGVVITLLDNK